VRECRVFRQRIALDLNDAPLPEALARIAQAAGVHVTYADGYSLQRRG